MCERDFYFAILASGISAGVLAGLIVMLIGWVTENFQGGEYDNPVEFTPEEAAIARVRQLHRPCSDPHLHDGGRCCLECSDYGRQGVVRMYPCDTIRALEGDA